MPDLPDFVLIGSDVLTLRKLQSLFEQMATEETATEFGLYIGTVGQLMQEYADVIEEEHATPAPDADNRPTDEQVRQWLYDAEYDWDDDSDRHWELPMPAGTFPSYYSDDYNPTLAKLFREILESRGRND